MGVSSRRDQIATIATRPTATAPLSITAAYNALGQRTQLRDATGTSRFTFDPLGRIAAVAAPQTGTIQYTYNARGDRTQLTYPDLTTVSYSYWPDRQLQTVSQGSTTLVGYRYDPVGRLQQLVRPSVTTGMTTTYQYDQADRLRELHTQTGSHTLLRVQQTVDRLGQTTGITETLGLTTRTIGYTYDGLQRLTSAAASPGTTASYTYDRAGNRTALYQNGVLTQQHSYNAANQVDGWSYDAAGNLTNDGSATSAYDALNRLTQHGTTAYAYNGDGVLVAQTTDGTTTRYSQDLAAALPQLLSDGTTRYLYGHERLAMQQGSTRTWYASDALGSVRATVSSAGTSNATASYDPWGTIAGSPIAPFGFTGELQQGGMVYLRARWYNTTNGTFTTRDPVAGVLPQPVSLHPYQYAANSPLRYTDPSGQFIPALLAAAALGAVVGAGMEYAAQVWANQHSTDADVRAHAFTHICLDRIGIAAVQGGIAGAVGFLLAPVLGPLTGTGVLGSILAGAVEGEIAAVGGQLAVNLLTGRAWHENLDSAALSGLLGGAVGGGLGWAARRGIENSRSFVTIFRGVNENHVAYEQALNGNAIPSKRWWHIFTRESTPYEHNAVSGGTRNSPYTSWSTDPEVAMNFALRPKGSGVVLTITVPKAKLVPSPNLKEVLLIQSGRVVSESEVLIKGIVKGA